MYRPKFQKTDYLLFLLSEIKTLQNTIFSAPIIPQWEVKLRQQALIKSTQASTSIEGNSLSLDEVSQILLNRENIGIRREQQEVKNYYQALIKLEKLREKSALTTKDILIIHRWIMGRLDDRAGHWRLGKVVVGNRRTGRINYVAPSAVKVPRLIKGLVDWHNHQDHYFNAVLKAGIIHYRLVWIHPFADGNGRTARALATLILLRERFDIKRFFALDDYYDADRKLYFDNIQAANRSGDLTDWLVYFSEGLLQNLQSVDRKIKRLRQITPTLANNKPIKISRREERVLDLINQKKEIKSLELQLEFKISRQAVYKLISKMIKKGLIRSIGGGRSTRYIFPLTEL